MVGVGEVETSGETGKGVTVWDEFDAVVSLDAIGEEAEGTCFGTRILRMRSRRSSS